MSEKYLVIDTRPYGLFSIFLHTIDCLKWCEENSYTPIVRWASGRIDINRNRQGADIASSMGDPKYVVDKENFSNIEKTSNNTKPCLYADNESDNVWEYYFEPINQIKFDDIKNLNHQISDIFMCGQLDFDLSNKFLIRNIHSYDKLKIWEINDTIKQLEHRKQVYELINKYVIVKDYILKKTESFYESRMKNKDLLIGVHIRGTDKKTEFPFKQLTIDNYIDKIQQILSLNNNKKYKIYVASDNNEAIVKIATVFGKENICAYPSARMPNFYGNIPICLNNEINKRKHGEETLIEMLLLSKCDTIIGTDSNLTAAAAYFNPNSELCYLDRLIGINS